MYDMLHYNYSNSLTRFLSGYHQLDDPNGNDNETAISTLCDDSTPEEEPRCTSNSSATSKSFTIAAILGLNNNENSNMCNTPSDLNVVNLSVHQNTPERAFVSNCNRLQLSVNRHNSFVSSSHYPVSTHGITSTKSSSK
ncbi:hypothetical protein GWI33_022856 [Rhynchophorus ferrugineus]|uniref:Uncharacterized protein n=1 Tax=Rhynchophorus ferrugineus TaxID=354439 RepID=A0A834MIQ0_RHYFE|nr:hypothetical protein GWI33_022856 [Rhynchophorus ferrugineus]